MSSTSPRFAHYIKQLFPHVKMLAIILGKDRRIAVIGPTAPTFFGCDMEDCIGEEIYKIVREDQIEKLNTSLRALEKDKNAIERIDLAFRVNENIVRLFDCSIFTVVDEQGVEQFCIYGQDVTEYIESKQDIELMNKKLNILGSATRHDVLNSLTGLFGYLELADVKCKDETVIKFIRKAKASAEIVKKQIEFTRTYQEIGSKKPTWINVAESIRIAYASLSDPRIPLDIDVDDLIIYADPMIEKVFNNLLDNARRHAEAKKVRIWLVIRPEFAELIMEDDGKGIPAAEKEIIFKRGYGKNTGFGLYMSREVLEITGMTIKEIGEEGKGARFVITIPHGKYRC